MRMTWQVGLYVWLCCVEEWYCNVYDVVMDSGVVICKKDSGLEVETSRLYIVFPSHIKTHKYDASMAADSQKKVYTCSDW
jgi:hypothetical protein